LNSLTEVTISAKKEFTAWWTSSGLISLLIDDARQGRKPASERGPKPDGELPIEQEERMLFMQNSIHQLRKEKLLPSDSTLQYFRTN
jgi:hypothetical protein